MMPPSHSHLPSPAAPDPPPDWMPGSTTYAVPRLPKPLPAFSLKALPIHPPGTSPRVFPSLPKANDLETLRKQLALVCLELDKSQASCSEVRLEKELLVAERTQIIVGLQALTALLSHGDAVLTASDETATVAMGERVRELRLALPEGNPVRRLCAESELQPHIQSLSLQLQYLWDQWRLEAKELRQAAAAAEAEAGRCRERLERVVEEAQRQAAAEAVASAREAYREQVETLESRLRHQKEDFDSKMRVMRNQVYECQQELAAAAYEATSQQAQLERLRSQQQQQQQQQQEQQRQRQRQQQEQERQQLLAAGAAAEQRCAECEAGRRRLDDGASLLQLLQQQLSQALREKHEAAQQALQEGSSLTEELGKAKEENQHLQAVIKEAERQLSLMRDDVAAVKQQQVQLRGKLEQKQKQKQQEQRQQ